ncbi:unannotated protein [freshwater metagenome]|uniref:Unannotated protein n=1 Tax=freshwater metagenome TaxID=449393 RepID=A0A6J7EJC2_9ZZZZ
MDEPGPDEIGRRECARVPGDAAGGSEVAKGVNGNGGDHADVRPGLEKRAHATGRDRPPTDDEHGLAREVE